MREVTASAFAVVTKVAEALDEDLVELCAGVVDIGDANAHGLDWASFCTLVDRLDERCGSERLAAEGKQLLMVPEVGPQMKVLRMVAGCKGLYWANFRFGGPSVFRVVSTTFQTLSDGRFVGTISIPPTHRDCPAFFQLCAGVFSALPRAIGLPEAQVRLALSPRRGTYVIEAPASMTIFDRLLWATRAVFSSRQVVDQLAAQNERLAEQYREAERARALAEAQRTEAELARAEALEALRTKSEFVGTISHELRTPLNGILGMTHLLRDTTLTPEQRDYSETIASSGQVLLTLINDLLDFSKIEAGRLTLDPIVTDVRELVEDVLQGASARVAGRPVDVIGDVAEDVAATVLVDALRLRQVLANLVDNAVKFTEAGEVVLSVRPADDGRRLALSVRDTGIGIAPEQKARIFDPFVQADGSTTRRYGGTGLGLAISSKIVASMGGVVALDSVPGVGSTFSFAVDAPPVAALPDAPVVAHRLRVDAPPSQREALAEMVRQLGWAVVDGPAPVAIVDVDHGATASAGERTIALSRTPDSAAGHFATVRKPVRRAELVHVLARAAAPAAPAAPAPAPLRVLVLDEDPMQRRIVARSVTRLGHQVADSDPDVVVVPFAVEDPEAIGAARATYGRARLVAIAARADHERCLALGADRAVERPVELEALRRAVGG